MGIYTCGDFSWAKLEGIRIVASGEKGSLATLVVAVVASAARPHGAAPDRPLLPLHFGHPLDWEFSQVWAFPRLWIRRWKKYSRLLMKLKSVEGLRDVQSIGLQSQGVIF